MSYNEIIKTFRIKCNLTQSDVAKEIGVTPSAYAMYERGEREPSVDTLCKLAKLFCTDMNGILGYFTEPADAAKLEHRKECYMSQFARLKIALERKAMRPSVLAYRLGVDRSTISNYLNGRYKAKSEMTNRIAEVLEVSSDWLNGFDASMEAKEPGVVKIPVLGYVAAGIPIQAITDILDYEELAPDMLKDGSEYFALKIKGQSMEPRIYDGDVVIVRVQPDVDSGQIGIVCVNGDEATCKKILKQAGGILLQPLNPTYETVFYTAEQIENIPITILGRVVELRGKF